MPNKYEILQTIREDGVIAVLRSRSKEQALSVARSCLAGGVRLIEVTFSTPGADDVIATISRSEDYYDAIIGAGTVLDASTARMAIIAGAKFIVGPTFDADVAKICNLYAIPYIPGVMTINEITEALKYGVEVVKLFPASEYKYGFIKAVHGPLPQIDVMVTGGVNIDNTADWLKAGAVAVGIGGNLTTVKDGMVESAGIYAEIVEAARKYCDAVSEGRA